MEQQEWRRRSERRRGPAVARLAALVSVVVAIATVAIKVMPA